MLHPLVGQLQSTCIELLREGCLSCVRIRILAIRHAIPDGGPGLASPFKQSVEHAANLMVQQPVGAPTLVPRPTNART